MDVHPTTNVSIGIDPYPYFSPTPGLSTRKKDSGPQLDPDRHRSHRPGSPVAPALK